MFNKENKPKIRFPEFTDDWKQRKLSEICNSISSSLTIKDVEEKGVANLYDANGIIGKTNKNIQATDYITIIKDGAGVGRVRLLSKNTSFIGTMVAITTNSNSLKYIYYLIQKINFKKYIKTGTIPHIYFKEYGNEQIKIPSVGEQQKIADFIFSIDTLISNYQSKLDNIKSLKKAFMQRVFPKKGETKPEIRFSGFNDDWVQSKLKDLASFLSGNGLNRNAITDNGKYECILYGHLYTDYGMIADKVFFKTDIKINSPVYSEYGDVLIPASDTTPTGLARATSIEKAGVLLGGDINIIRPNKDINGSCLSLAINANKKSLLRLIKGTTVRHINNSDIQYIDISLPKDPLEQDKIRVFFKKLDKNISLHKRKLEILQKIKKGLLQQMFV